MGKQSLIYSFVARGKVILAEFTEFTGNFTSIAAQCLQKLPATNNKFTYNCDGHTFNYLVDNGFSCVSADESGNRFFLSDSRHHRIIVFDGNGKILDCIGSSPGFEDGNFESAKMVCPASSFYDAAEDSLYFVDSENHAIRKADLGKRVVETLYPNYDTSKNSNSI